MSQKTLEIAQANMKKWLDVLGTKDPKQVAELYSEGNLFLPTVSGDFKKGRPGAEEYFVHFLAKNPEGEVTEEDVIEICDCAYLHAGTYTFLLDSDDGRVEVKARFSYLWKKDKNNEWKIEHHHSSIRP